jgi:hypothetical protein
MGPTAGTLRSVRYPPSRARAVARLVGMMAVGQVRPRLFPRRYLGPG